MLIIAAIINLFVLHFLTKAFKFKNISFYKALITIGVGLIIGLIWYGFTSKDPFYLMEILWSIATILLIKYLYDVDWKSGLKVWIILLIVGIIVEAILSLFLMGII
jgi:hypothetical protein